MNKKAERGQTTRERLIAVATRLFADRGYEDTSIEAVLHKSGLSRGALYHHFASKEALFEAVLEAVEEQVGVDLLAEVEGVADPVELVRTACLAWIRLAGDPVVQRIILLDGPSVLGWQRWREIEERYGLGGMKATLRLVAETGRLPEPMVDTFAHMLGGAINEAALLVARADDGPAAQREATAAVREFLDRLF
jgi:AcrR family transcriptional regulator